MAVDSRATIPPHGPYCDYGAGNAVDDCLACLIRAQKAQLRQAQRKCDEGWEAFERSNRVAIKDLERLKEAQEERKLYWEAYQRAVVVVRALRGCRNAARVERDEAIERAEAAEALLLRIHKVCKHTLEGDRSSGWYKMVVFDIGQLTTPAEALAQRGGGDAAL